MKGATVVRRTGELVAIAGDLYGEGLAAVPVALGVDDATDASGGRDAGCAVRKEGAVVCWGNEFRQRLER